MNHDRDVRDFLFSPAVVMYPDDFGERLVHLKSATGLSWNRFAECIGIDPRQLQRWREGTVPGGQAMFALFLLASHIPGGVRVLLTGEPGRSRRGG